MGKASELPHRENWDFDRVIWEADHPKAYPYKRGTECNSRSPYAYTKLEKEMQDAKNRQRADRRGDH